MRRWLALLATVGAATTLLVVLDAPTPYLVGPLVGGLAAALLDLAPEVPAPAGTAAQGVIGVSVGVLVTADLLVSLLRDGAVVVPALVATLMVSVLWGQVLRAQPGVSGVTATFASIAGGASGVVAAAREVGADEPVVATIQYLRVLVVLFTMPVVAGLYDPSASADGGPGGVPLTLEGASFTAAMVALGLALVRLLPFPGSAILLPMGVTAVVHSTGLWGAQVPDAVANASYAVIGVQVGVKFTRGTVRLIARLLPLALVQVGGTIVTCAGIGWVISALTDISALDAYLATTPGGLYAVVAVALSTGGDTGLVCSLQVLRLFGALLLVPVVAAWQQRRR